MGRVTTAGNPGPGEMESLVRSHDWARTPLGPVAGWSASLRWAVKFVLGNRFPLLLWWGPDFCQIYNDAYRPVLGAKHPRSLGQPAAECWHEIWDVIGPLIRTPYEGGPATWDDDLSLELNRRGFPEETHFTVAYSALADESVPNGIGGVLATVHEITAKVFHDREMAALRDLGLAASGAKTAEEVCEGAVRVFQRHAQDVPFALLYLLEEDGTTARLAAASEGVATPEFAPRTVVLEGEEAAASWPLKEAVASGQPIVVGDLATRFGHTVPDGPWSDPPKRAVVVPLPSPRKDRPAGLSVLGVSPRRALDDLYQAFYELAAGQVASGIANARSYEEERRRAEALAELDRAKTVFFSNVSHEFRTPLTLSLGPVTDALQDAVEPLTERQRERLELVHRNQLRLLKMVNHLLDFSRIEAGRLQPSYERVDLATMTADLASVFRAAVERAGMRLRVDCVPLTEPVYVDPDMWEKIILNLVSNAFKFTLDGEIRVIVADGGNGAEVRVEDTGIGIADDDLPHLFERFHRIEGTRSRTHEGSGIGLALVQELVHLHGGSVEVKSRPDEGSTFTIRIPYGTAHLPADRIRTEPTRLNPATNAAPFVEEALRWLPDAVTVDAVRDAPPDESREVPGVLPEDPSPLVLIVDDNADLREYLQSLLGVRYRVQTAPDGILALRAVDIEVPDLILADVMMPNLDGFGLLDQIRAHDRTRSVPVILLSARAGEEARIEGLEAGADDYLVKPFGARELLARVEASLALARVRKEAADRLTREYENLKDILMRAPLAIALLKGADLVPELVNPHFQALLRQGGAVGRPADEAWVGRALEPWQEILTRVYETGEAFTATEMRMEASGGREAPYFTVVVQPQRDGDGTVAGVLVYAMDVSAQVRGRQQMEVSVRARDEFLSIATHELRTPVTGIQLNGELLLKVLAQETPDDGRIRRYVTWMLEQITRLTELIDQLLDVSRIQNGRLPMNLRRIDLRDLVCDVVARFHLTPGISDRVVVEIPEEPCSVVGDRERLEQVLVNLVDNAVKYSPDGAPIRLRLLAEATDVSLIVEDAGIGIPRGALAEIFEPFSRAENALRSNLPGMGLGLHICRRIVEAHHGTIRAESPGDGGGAVVTVSLPRAALRGSGDHDGQI